MKILARIRGGNRLGIFFFFFLFVYGGVLIAFQSPLVIHTRSISHMFSEMVTHVAAGELYSFSDESLHYRTNSVICMINYIKDSNAMGIGVGNTARWLAVSMPNADYYLNQQSVPMEMKVLSPHFALLEFISDCGIWAMVLLFAILKSAFKKIMDAKRDDFVDFWFVSIVMSFPMWCMSASGIYTIYYLFILIACFYEWYQMKASGDIA